MFRMYALKIGLAIGLVGVAEKMSIRKFVWKVVEEKERCCRQKRVANAKMP